MTYKRLSLPILMILTILFLSGCIFLNQPYNTPTPVPNSETDNVAATITPIPEITSTQLITPTPTLAPTAESTATPTIAITTPPQPTVIAIGDLPPEDIGAAHYTNAGDQIGYISSNIGSDIDDVEERCAYITGASMRMDGQTDILFDYVDWLSNPEARDQYLIDFPSATSDDLEILDQIGYIRNVNPRIRSFETSTQSRYFLIIPMTSTIGEVNYDDFRDWLFATTDTKFVIVCTVDGVIARVEAIYMP